MTPHPDFADRDVPGQVALGPYRMAMLTAADVDEDFAAVTRSVPVLRGLFGGDWPEGLTLADDLTDLHWHHREFTARRSFAWIIRDADVRYMGCAYLYPEIGARGAGHTPYWFAEMPDRLAHLAAFGPLYRDWLGALLPPGYALRLSHNGPQG